MTPTEIDKRIAEVVLTAYRRGFTIQSDYARNNAGYIGMSASMGLISTRLYGQVFSREWRPTIRGLTWLEDTFDLHMEDDDTVIHEGHND